MISRVSKTITRPSSLFRYQAPWIRGVYTAVATRLKARSFRERRRAYRKLSNVRTLLDVEVLQEDGFGCATGLAGSLGLPALLREAKCDFEFHQSLAPGKHRKNYLQKVRWQSPVSINHPYLAFALNETVVATVAEYFGYVPVLGEIHLCILQTGQGSRMKVAKSFILTMQIRSNARFSYQ